MKRIVAVGILGLFLARGSAAGVVPVVDAGNIVQSTISAIADVAILAKQVTGVINQYTQIANEYTQIANQVQQIANQVKNLEKFDGSAVQQLLTVSNQITVTLGKAQGVSFDLDQAVTQFDALYPKVEAAMTAGELLTQRQKWVEHRRSAASTGMQAQAVQRNLQGMASNLSQLLSKASTTTGAHQIAQVQAQQTGLTQAMLLQIQQQLASNGRIDAQRTAQDASMEGANLRQIEKAFAPMPEYNGANGKLMQYDTWKGK